MHIHIYTYKHTHTHTRMEHAAQETHGAHGATCNSMRHATYARKTIQYTHKHIPARRTCACDIRRFVFMNISLSLSLSLSFCHPYVIVLTASLVTSHPRGPSGSSSSRKSSIGGGISSRVVGVGGEREGGANTKKGREGNDMTWHGGTEQKNNRQAWWMNGRKERGDEKAKTNTYVKMRRRSYE